MDSLELILSRFRQNILKIYFEPSIEGFESMKRVSLEYMKSVRIGKPDESLRRVYELYCDMLDLEADDNFLENRYPGY